MAQLVSTGMVFAMIFWLSSPKCARLRLLRTLFGVALGVVFLAPHAVAESTPALPAMLTLKKMTYAVSEGERNELIVAAAVAQLLPEEDRALLQGIHLRMGSKAPDGIPGGGLEMRCEQGVFNLKSKDFEASGNVRGVTADGRRFHTEGLHYRAADGLIRSDQPVVLYEQGAVMEGSGFEYYVQADRFRLRNAKIRQGE